MDITEHPSLQTLAFEDTTQTKLPALAIQTEIGPAPDYSSELYRLYLGHSDETTIQLEGQLVTLKKGRLLTLSPGEVVSFKPDALVESISFHHNFFCVRVMRHEVFCDGVVFNRLSGLPIVEFPETELQLLKSRFHELNTIVKAESPFTHERALNVLRTFLLHAADFKMQSVQTLEGTDEQRFQFSPLVLAFQNLVEETYTEHRDAKFYSDQLNVSGITLSRKVKSELGQSVMQTVNERLAIEARVALRSGLRSVKEVAFDLGFNDPLYFSRFFRKHFGNPPSQYFLDPQVNEGA